MQQIITDTLFVQIDFDQNPMGRTAGIRSVRVVEEEETKRGFELPDLNMTPNEEESAMMMMS